MLEHSTFVTLTDVQFDMIFGFIKKDKEIREALLPLLLLEGLPDAAHWARCLGEIEDRETATEKLARAVSASFDHQSQAATDCRWVRVMTLFAQDKMVFAEKMRERANELIQYPNKGDMRSVRASIRAMEMMTRRDKEISDRYAESFWAECFQKTSCMPMFPDSITKIESHVGLFDHIIDVYDELSDHFMRTIHTTAIDARHDGAFGLTFYVIQLLIFALRGEIGQTVAGRFLVRSALEAYITLSYLAKKDDSTIWTQYRNYGAGQMKLAYLKNVDTDALPKFLSIDLLESLANEDMWMEFQDINLGAWAERNLRTMAQESGVKDIYDRQYDTLSGYVHGNWGAVRHAVYADCANPLHRFHRIPIPPRVLVQDALPDLVALANLALDRLAGLYPPFKRRLRSARSDGQSGRTE